MKMHNQILTVMVATAMLGAVAAISLQQANAPRGCNGCTAFKKLTHEFEKDVIDAPTTGDPNTIASLLEQDNQDVLRTFELTPR